MVPLHLTFFRGIGGDEAPAHRGGRARPGGTACLVAGLDAAARRLRRAPPSPLAQKAHNRIHLLAPGRVGWDA